MTEIDLHPYVGLDPALVPLHLHLAALVPADPAHGMTVEEVVAEMPVELDVLAVGGHVALGSSPPLYYVETGYRAAPHRLRVTIVEEGRLHDEPPGHEGGWP